VEAPLRHRRKLIWEKNGSITPLYMRTSERAHNAVLNAKKRHLTRRRRTMSRAINWRRRALLFYCVATLGFGVGIGAAGAHSRLTKSDPAARAVVETAPKELKLWFNEAVEPAFAKVWIIPAEGSQIPLTSRGDSSDRKLLVVTMPDNVPAGAVMIGYHVLSVDGHTIEDKLSFTLKAK
jgi:copper resistance protein C